MLQLRFATWWIQKLRDKIIKPHPLSTPEGCVECVRVTASSASPRTSGEGNCSCCPWLVCNFTPFTKHFLAKTVLKGMLCKKWEDVISLLDCLRYWMLVLCKRNRIAAGACHLSTLAAGCHLAKCPATIANTRSHTQQLCAASRFHARDSDKLTHFKQHLRQQLSIVAGIGGRHAEPCQRVKQPYWKLSTLAVCLRRLV